MLLAKLEQKKADLEFELQTIREKIKEVQSHTLVKCETNFAYRGEGCGMASEIGDLTYIQTHFYIHPHGCTGGDYWKCGEGQFDCPHCGYRNRLYNREDIQELRLCFKNTEDSHED